MTNTQSIITTITIFFSFAMAHAVIKSSDLAPSTLDPICEGLANNCQDEILSYAQDLFTAQNYCADVPFLYQPDNSYLDENLIRIGSVFIGCEPSDTGHKLHVKDGIIAKALKVDLGEWCDYVFDEDYELLPLLEVKDYINENGHLPGIPSGEVIEAEGGFYLDEATVWQQEKIEELFLYAIELEKEIDNLLEGN